MWLENGPKQYLNEYQLNSIKMGKKCSIRIRNFRRIGKKIEIDELW